MQHTAGSPRGNALQGLHQQLQLQRRTGTTWWCLFGGGGRLLLQKAVRSSRAGLRWPSAQGITVPTQPQDTSMAGQCSACTARCCVSLRVYQAHFLLLTRASAPKSSTSPPRNTMRCRNSRPNGSPAISAVLGARIGCPFASIHGLSRPLLSKPAGRPMMTACIRVAARLWLPLLKALGLLLLVVLLHACWHGAFKADICRNAKRSASEPHAQAVPNMQQTGVECCSRYAQRRSRPPIHTAGVISAESCTSMP